FGQTPVYDSEGAKVGARREYTSVVFAGAEPLGTGHGATKQEAEQDAARAALEGLVGALKPAQAVKPPRTTRTRTRRAARQPRAKKEAAQPEEPVAPLAVLPSGDGAPEAVDTPEPPPSRQFGAPIE
ncbi:MAG TPA: putative dsRNA-binding protein, partial [Candidatus Dormibacteraeota bacterium]|nr:putative dsRNA-binding protein [Candidatus Dormibacteraeota bacterium]